MAEPTLLQQAEQHIVNVTRALAEEPKVSQFEIETLFAIRCLHMHLAERHAAGSKLHEPMAIASSLQCYTSQPAQVPSEQQVNELIRKASAHVVTVAIKTDMGSSDALDLTELQKLCDAATPGPWTLDESVFDIYDSEGALVLDLQSASHANARFVCAARDALPKLIAQVRQLQGELEYTDKCLRFETTKDDSERQRLGRELFGDDHA